jgi:hypothetical protein
VLVAFRIISVGRQLTAVHVRTARELPRTVGDWPRFWKRQAAPLHELFRLQTHADEEMARAMRKSWICLFDDWEEGVMSEG